MATPSLFFGGTVSQNYEDYLGAFLFEPFAVDLASRLNFDGVSKVLELACGSGRLTKHIAETLPATAEFTATDLSADMISVANTKVTSDRVTWATADIMDLPFTNDSFDLIVCQFGLMLVPDQMKAFAEILRVLKPGGKVVFNTWTDRDYNKVWAIGDEVLQSFFGENIVGQNPGPFALGDKEVVFGMLKTTGFSKTNATSMECIGETDSAANVAYGFIHGLPIGSFVQKRGAELMPEIIKSLEENYRSELGEHPLKASQKGLIFEAVK
ncbi:class I SAM-dependent methyltransferase [Mucilaginibacter sp. L196]|uniref:class I SAM-dependent methyltransferase n=1 Tax=Mucilaginibacter sp. L196 TaxID=1641870 RepID=UPI00131B3674|nr:class I SAM-dependent methyltransferase [Mucilaginibacter sp. L196]